VYVTGTGVAAFDVQTGAQVWKTPPFTRSIPTYVSVRDGRVYTAEAVAYAFDAQTGRELWRFTPGADASLSQNVADDHAFYVGTRGHRVYALHVADGAPLWEINLGADWPYENLVKGIALSGDTVYAAAERTYSQNGYLSAGVIVALDRFTGRELWRHQNGDGTSPRGVIGAPAAAGNYLVVSDHRGNAFYAVDRFTGKEVWRTPTEPGFSGPEASPIVIGNVVYGSAIDAYVYALDLSTGRVLWRTRPAMGGSHYHAVCNNTVFNNLQSLGMVERSSGRKLGLMFTEDERVTSGFAVQLDRIFFFTTKAAYALKCP
jgi:glucose dehydrogenase